MLVALAILGAVRAFPITQAPSPIVTTAQAASCIDGNTCRTLWEIVRSCLFTILLCTWVSVHPNIPGPDEEWPKVTYRRVGITLTALIAPEFIVAWAMRQRILAHELAEQHKAHGWTRTHGFFALMGGFMEYSGNEPVQTLLPEQLKGYSLTGMGNFPRIAIEEIQDKSKGDAISKGLVLLQTGWFVTQCIARGAQRLPITELEVVTVAFAGLNLVIYWLWWDKPLNVRRAIRVYKKLDSNNPGTDEPIVTKEAGFWPPLRRSLSALRSAIATQWQVNRLLLVLVVIFGGLFGVLFGVVVFPVYAIARAAGDISSDRGIIKDEKRIGTFYPPASMKWKSAKTDFFLAASIAAIAMVFGVIHCIAWPFPFPSVAERTVWHVSSVVITGAPIACLLLWMWLQLLDHGAVAAMLFCVTILYVISRASLLVLPFLSLRALPLDTYRSVQWTSLIPHF